MPPMPPRRRSTALVRTRTRTRTVRVGRARRRARITIPLAIVAGFASPAKFLWDRRNMQGVGNEAVRIVTGYDPVTAKWDWNNLKPGAMPIFAGFMVHALANAVGLNRVLARTGVPFIRL